MATEKRLTEKHYNGKGYYMKCSGLCHFDGHCANCDELVKIVDRLGEYEDKAKQTVDAVEVLHGQWIVAPVYKFNRQGKIINYWNNHHCSECKTEKPFVPPYNYCPNCGAKMDGDGNGT